MRKPSHVVLSVVVFCYAAFLFLASSLPLSVPEQPEFPGVDKFIHALLYGIFALLIFAYARSVPRPPHPWILFLLPALVAAGYGGAMEIWQHFLPNRFCDLSDAMANLLGALAAQAGAWRFWKSG